MWIVGVCWCPTFVCFKKAGDEESEALLNYDQNGSKKHSKVLFTPNGVVWRCQSAESDSKGIGVATIIEYHNELDFQLGSFNISLSKKAIIEKKLALGELPFVPPHRSSFTQQALKTTMQLTFQRTTVKFFGCAPYRDDSTLYYYDVNQYPGVKGHVALTIDDAPGRFGPESSELLAVKEILAQHKNTTATFMVIGTWCRDSHGHRDALISLLKDGHELGNHGMLDRSYENDDPHDFGDAVSECSEIINQLHQAAGLESKVRWFRAPHGRYTKPMAHELRMRGLTNVMCDTYASCPIVQDSNFIGELLGSRCQDGSIILLHMPEKPIRQWCMNALEQLLKCLERRGLQAVTVSELERLSKLVPCVETSKQN